MTYHRRMEGGVGIHGMQSRWGGSAKGGVQAVDWGQVAKAGAHMCAKAKIWKVDVVGT